MSENLKNYLEEYTEKLYQWLHARGEGNSREFIENFIKENDLIAENQERNERLRTVIAVIGVFSMIVCVITLFFMIWSNIYLGLKVFLGSLMVFLIMVFVTAFLNRRN